MIVEGQSDRIVFGLTGAVRDTSTGNPVANAEVEVVQGANSGRSFRTGSDGFYRIDQLTPGSMRVRARAEGYFEQTQDVSLTGNQDLNFELSQPAMFTFFGVVTDGRRNPLEGVEIRTEIGNAVTVAAGRFEIRSTRNSLRVSRLVPPNGYEPTEHTLDGRLITLLPGQNSLVVRRILELTISLSSQMRVDGTRQNVHPVVRYDTGEVVQLVGSRGYDVQVTSSNPTVLRAATGGSGDGAYAEPLSPGTATVTARYWGIVSAAVTVQVVPR